MLAADLVILDMVVDALLPSLSMSVYLHFLHPPLACLVWLT